MSAPAFRSFRPEDLPAMQRIRQRAFAPVFRSFAAIVGERIAPVAFARADAEQAALLEDLCKPAPGRDVLVAEAAGRIIGFACFTIDPATGLGEIGLNAVDPEEASRGVGTAMYAEVLARMRAAGMRAAAVSTGGDPSHAPARRAYEKAGFGTPIPSVTLYRPL